MANVSMESFFMVVLFGANLICDYKFSYCPRLSSDYQSRQTSAIPLLLVLPITFRLSTSYMGWLDKLFGQEEKKAEAAAPAVTGDPFAGLEGIRFGRYSDNNKSYKKTQSWYLAEDKYKEKAYTEALTALFDYMTDETEGNVIYNPDGNKFTFELIQGSKKVYGRCDG